MTIINRLILVAWLLVSPASFQAADAPKPIKVASEIDRRSVVTRHNPELHQVNARSALQVGNGDFAFSTDVTGLQTFYGYTLSNWGWHEEPLPAGMRPEDRKRTEFITHGRKRFYLAPHEQPELARWLNDNPHRADLGRLRFVTGPNGDPLEAKELKGIRQELDLWRGLLVSEFELNGKRVHVETVCHAGQDTVAVRIISPLIHDGNLSVVLDFPYPLPTGNDWGNPELHQTELTRTDGHRADFLRKADAMVYHTAFAWSEGASLREPPVDPPLQPLRILKAEYGAGTNWMDVTLNLSRAIRNNRLFVTVDAKLAGRDPAPKVRKKLKVSYALGAEELQAVRSDRETFEIQHTSNQHSYRLSARGQDSLTIVCAYSPNPLSPSVPSFADAQKSSAKMWKDYWTSGGAIDLSGSKDARWEELERRIVLSQYLMRVNSAGSMPPPEIGLLGIDFWRSKFHLEMTAWHGAHFMLWDRPEFVNGWVRWFQDVGLPAAKREAQAEGWAGAKWLKTPDPFGRWESWDHGPNRVTQNAHPFHWAELFYRAHPTRDTLETWKDILFETARMMVDFVAWDEASGRYILGPPVMSGAEGNSGFESWNSTSELNYWAMSLEIAQKWRERLGMAREPKWDDVLKRLSRPMVKDGVYIEAESDPDIWNQTERGRFLRPAWLEVYGCVRGPMIDPAVMEKTYERVAGELRSHVWKGNLWGCDYPMMAMTAARLGRQKEAIDWLLYATPLNEYTANGACAGWYLPGNGGLLWAVAMMAAGWDGAPDKPNPGFPEDGSWTVKWEGLKKAP